VFNILNDNIIKGFILFSLFAALSACGSSSSSNSSAVPSTTTIYYAHNLVFAKNGMLLSTGYNAFGQLGTGNTDWQNVPGPLSLNIPFKGFATGGDHSVAFTDVGEVFSWGCNYNGQLGDASTNYSLVPIKTALVSDVKAVAAGAFHTLSLAGDGSVWAWGWNNYGQLGYATASGYSAIPSKVSRAVFPNFSTNVSAIAANGYNSMALANGKVWTWGLNNNGQLGYNSVVIGSSQTPLPVTDLPADTTVIAAGSAFSYAVADGKVWAWGNNSNGQLGNGTVMADSNIPGTCATASIPSHIPVQVMTSSGIPLLGVAQVAAGFHHGLARLSDGSVWAWGSNLLGQLGTGLAAVAGDSCYAVKVALPKDVNGVPLKAIDIRAFGSSSMAQTEDGAWYVWGYNLFGQLGVGTDGYNSTVSLPVKMAGF
jgi:alpha-tubulin suppressor-like RCC1 family protein